MTKVFYPNASFLKEAVNEFAAMYELSEKEVLTLLSLAVGQYFSSKEPALISKTGYAYFFSQEDEKMIWKKILDSDISKIKKIFLNLFDLKIKNDFNIKMHSLIVRNENLFYMKVTSFERNQFHGELFYNIDNRLNNMIIKNVTASLPTRDIYKSDLNKIKINNIIVVSVSKFSYKNGKIECFVSRKKISFLKRTIMHIAKKCNIDRMIVQNYINPEKEIIVIQIKKELKNSKELVELFFFRLKSILGLKIIYKFL